jgi:hypothetical protein
MMNGLLRESSEYNGLATWAKDGSWGYCTPIYILNHIIRLQAVVEIINNEMASTLSLLTKQSAVPSIKTVWL